LSGIILRHSRENGNPETIVGAHLCVRPFLYCRYYSVGAGLVPALLP
jgi:hypothetical protein